MFYGRLATKRYFEDASKNISNEVEKTNFTVIVLVMIRTDDKSFCLYPMTCLLRYDICSGY